MRNQIMVPKELSAQLTKQLQYWKEKVQRLELID